MLRRRICVVRSRPARDSRAPIARSCTAAPASALPQPAGHGHAGLPGTPLYVGSCRSGRAIPPGSGKGKGYGQRVKVEGKGRLFLPHRLDRTMVIRAKPMTVFRLHRTPRWASLWGPGFVNRRPRWRPGRHRAPGRAEVSGEVQNCGPPSGSRSPTVRVGHALPARQFAGDDDARSPSRGHPLPDPRVRRQAARDEHVQGWRCQCRCSSTWSPMAPTPMPWPPSIDRFEA